MRRWQISRVCGVVEVPKSSWVRIGVSMPQNITARCRTLSVEDSSIRPILGCHISFNSYLCLLLFTITRDCIDSFALILTGY